MQRVRLITCDKCVWQEYLRNGPIKRRNPGNLPSGGPGRGFPGSEGEGQPSGERFVLPSRSWEIEAITLGMWGAEVYGFACLEGLGYLPACS